MRNRMASKRFSSEKSSVLTKEALSDLNLHEFDLLPNWEPTSGKIYTKVRAISSRINQNLDGWPSDELKKSYKTFLGKPVFVNHVNDDPRKARGVVVAARFVENSDDKYIEVIQEVDAERFPILARELVSGGLDSVSMGAEARIIKCSYCGNEASDMITMCSHVLGQKGQVLERVNDDGSREDVLVYEECVTPGTSILLGDLTHKPIEEIRVGDEVRDHNGRTQKVTKTITQDVSDKTMVTITAEGSSDRLNLTDNHPMFTIKPTNVNNHTSFTKSQVEKGRIAPEFIPAGDLQVGDWVAEPIPENSTMIEKVQISDYVGKWETSKKDKPVYAETPLIQVVDSGYFGSRWEKSCESCGTIMSLRKSDTARRFCSSLCWGSSVKDDHTHGGKNSLPIPDEIFLDEKFGTLVGWYLAEGSVGYNKRGRPSYISFSLHIDETNEAIEISNLVASIFGVVCTHRESTNGDKSRTVTASNVKMAEFFTVFGRGCKNKQLPNEWMSAPLPFLDGVVEGHFLGDRSHGGGEVGGVKTKTAKQQVTTSVRLYEQLYAIRLMLGQTPVGRVVSRAGRNEKVKSDLYGIRTRTDRDSRGRMSYAGWRFKRVKNIEHNPYTGTVHNLEIEGSHSYVAEGFSVHNCRNISFFELSYVFDPADETAVVSNVLTANKKRGYGETSLPPQVDTLRDEEEDLEGYFIDPPREFQEPDLDKEYPEFVEEELFDNRMDKEREDYEMARVSRNSRQSSRRGRRVSDRARMSRRRRYAEEFGRNDQGEQEEVFISQTPPAEPLETGEGATDAPNNSQSDRVKTDQNRGTHTNFEARRRRARRKRAMDRGFYEDFLNYAEGQGIDFNEVENQNEDELYRFDEAMYDFLDVNSVDDDDRIYDLMDAASSFGAYSPGGNNHLHGPYEDTPVIPPSQEDYARSKAGYPKNSRRRRRSSRRKQSNELYKDFLEYAQGQGFDLDQVQEDYDRAYENNDGGDSTVTEFEEAMYDFLGVDSVDDDPRLYDLMEAPGTYEINHPDNFRSSRKRRSRRRPVAARNLDMIDDMQLLDGYVTVSMGLEEGWGEDEGMTQEDLRDYEEELDRRGIDPFNNDVYSSRRRRANKRRRSRHLTAQEGLDWLENSEPGTKVWSWDPRDDEYIEFSKKDNGSWYNQDYRTDLSADELAGNEVPFRRSKRRRRMAEQSDDFDLNSRADIARKVEDEEVFVSETGPETQPKDASRRRRVANTMRLAYLRRVAEYNGWSNWETWNTALWYGNDPGAYDLARSAQSPEELRENAPYVVGDEVDFDQVDWNEVYDAFEEDRTASRRRSRRARRRLASTPESLANEYGVTVDDLDSISGKELDLSNVREELDPQDEEFLRDLLDNTDESGVYHASRRSSRRRRMADSNLDLAAPDGRVNVEAPVSGTTDENAQSSQFDKGDYGNNAGDDLADPDLSTDQNWAPGEGKTSSRASQIEGMRLAEAMVEAGLEAHDDRWKLADAYTKLPAAIVRDRIALLSRTASVKTAAQENKSQRTLKSARKGPGFGKTPSLQKSANKASDDYTLYL